MNTGKVLMSCTVLLTVFISYAQTKSIVVAQDGGGNYKTVQQAFNSIPFNNKKPVFIFIKPGIYKEKIHLYT